MKTIFFTFFIFMTTVASMAQEPDPREKTDQYYDGYRRYYSGTDRTVRTTVNDEDVLATGTTASGVRAYVRNPYTGSVIVPNTPPGSGVVVMSDAHLDAKLFIEWVDAGRPPNHAFMKTYEGVNFKKFMDGIPKSVIERNANPGRAVQNMDIVWGGDPFDRKAFEALPLDQRKKAFRLFAQEVKGMQSVDGVKYNFIASLGDHEVTKVNGVWNNSAAFSAAKKNGPQTLAGLTDDALEKMAKAEFDLLLERGPVSVTYMDKGVEVTKSVESFSDITTKDGVKAKKEMIKKLKLDFSNDPDQLAKARTTAQSQLENFRANPKPIDIPKVTLADDISNLGAGMIDSERAKLLEALGDTKLSNGRTLLENLDDIGKGGVLDANTNQLHREILEKYGKVVDDFSDVVGGGAKAEVQLTAKRQADALGGLMSTEPRPISVAEGDFLKSRGVKPPSQARALNGIDDTLEISKYGDEFAEVFQQEGFRVDRSTFTPYEATVQTGADGRQYAHRHVQYGNLDNALLEKPQLSQISGHNAANPKKRIPYPDMRLRLADDQLETIKRITNVEPEGLLGKHKVTDDVFKKLEDAARSGDDAAKKLLSTQADGLLGGQHTVKMSGSTAQGMRDAGLIVPGRTDVLENAAQQTIGQHLQGEDGRLVQNHSKTVGGRSTAGDVSRVNRMDDGAVLFTSDTHNPSMNLAAATDPDTARALDQICPGCVGTRPEINSGSMSASAKNPGRPNTIAIQFGDDAPTHLQVNPKTGVVENFDAVPKEQREWLKKLHAAQDAGDDAFVKFLMNPETGRDPLTRKSMLGDDAVDALGNILPCK